jgi:hypothetical protein
MPVEERGVEHALVCVLRETHPRSLDVQDAIAIADVGRGQEEPARDRYGRDGGQQPIDGSNDRAADAAVGRFWQRCGPATRGGRRGHPTELSRCVNRDRGRIRP